VRKLSLCRRGVSIEQQRARLVAAARIPHATGLPRPYLANDPTTVLWWAVVYRSSLLLLVVVAVACGGDGASHQSVDATLPALPDAQAASPDACVGTVCGDSCVVLDDDPRHCGACGHDCTQLPGVTGSVACVAGVCQVAAACETGKAHCSVDADDGCETDLSLPAHCGDCGTSCTEPTPMCAADPTAGYGCVSGCEAPTPDRCAMSCVDKTANAAHCGACDNACTSPLNATPTCIASACDFACDANYKRCGDECIPSTACCTDADCTAPSHGAATCGANQSCVLTCETGYALSGTTCEPVFAITCPGNATGTIGTPVVLTASALSGGQTITGYDWSVISGPSSGGISSSFAPVTPNGSTERFMAGVPGTYTVLVVAGDSAGATRSCTSQVTLSGAGLRVVLTWNGSGDLDLHLHNNVTSAWFSSPNDCFYANRTPSWDAAGTDDDPTHDIDNADADGPEQSRITIPKLGESYTIGVHNYTGAAGRTATVKVYCGASTTPVATYTSRALAGTAGGTCTANDFWRVARVSFSQLGVCSVTNVNTYSTSSQACTTF
jgi:hypothetical protein